MTSTPPTPVRWWHVTGEERLLLAGIAFLAVLGLAAKYALMRAHAGDDAESAPVATEVTR